MRVGIDIAQLSDGSLTGIPLYIESLVRELLRQQQENADGERYVLVGNRQGAAFPDILARRGLGLDSSAGRAHLVPGWDLRIGPHLPRVAASPLGWATRKLDGRVLNGASRALTNASLRPMDVFHHTSRLRVAPGRARRHIATIYDLTTRYYPQTHRPGNIADWERVFRFAREKADLVITDSESARDDVIRDLKIAADRVRAIPLAVRPTLPRSVDNEASLAVRRKYGLGEDAPAQPFVLAVGSMDPRKNLPRLIEAFAALGREPGLNNLRLVLVGASGLGSQPVLDALERLGVRERVVLTGYAPDEDVAALMAGCACFAYPSLYEGFGLPVLEALALGAPVVTSNVSSLPEVAGDAALLVDPHETNAIADALRRVLSEPTLAADLRRRGPERAGLFSWERCAREHRQAYRDVAAL